MPCITAEHTGACALPEPLRVACADVIREGMTQRRDRCAARTKRYRLRSPKLLGVFFSDSVSPSAPTYRAASLCLPVTSKSAWLWRAITIIKNNHHAGYRLTGIQS